MIASNFSNRLAQPSPRNVLLFLSPSRRFAGERLIEFDHQKTMFSSWVTLDLQLGRGLNLPVVRGSQVAHNEGRRFTDPDLAPLIGSWCRLGAKATFVDTGERIELFGP
jgi:hypothetical protein